MKVVYTDFMGVTHEDAVTVDANGQMRFSVVVPGGTLPLCIEGADKARGLLERLYASWRSARRSPKAIDREVETFLGLPAEPEQHKCRICSDYDCTCTGYTG